MGVAELALAVGSEGEETPTTIDEKRGKRRNPKKRAVKRTLLPCEALLLLIYYLVPAAIAAQKLEKTDIK